MAKPAVLVISSHVARGSVGNRAMVFALERLGFTVWAVPTVILPHHPGHGPAERIVTDAKQFSELLQALIRNGRARDLSGIVSGYLVSADHAHAVAGLVRAVKSERPDALYICDPIVGDAGRLYVGEELAVAIRDELLPLADAATPNAFEASWLAGQAASDAVDFASLAQTLPPPAVLVTSAPALMRGHIGNLLRCGGDVRLFEHPALNTPAKGTGDLLAALLLGRRLEGRDWAKAAELAVASVFEVVAGTAKAGADELLLAEFQQSLVQPHANVSVRRLGARFETRPGGTTEPEWVAGVDGCRAGWVAVLLDAAGAEPPRMRVLQTFGDILDAPERPQRIAVDIPIGLPDRIVGSGRVAETAVRPLLGDRQSSVFSTPARPAVMSETYAEACAAALAHSDPPRKISRQSFALLPKIREVDAVLTRELAARVIETHPEVAFRELNHGEPMSLPKKAKNTAHAPGLEQRIDLLVGYGFTRDFFLRDRPAGVGLDDLVDAAVSALVARRSLRGEAVSYPREPEHDARGLPIAIWA